jgi:hypothetical protein
MDLREIRRGGAWTGVVWPGLVNVAMNLPVPYDTGNLLAG